MLIECKKKKQLLIKKSDMDIKIKELTKEQKKKADRIIEFLLKLKKDGVHPIVIDGGGGSGIEFVRCKDMQEFGDIVLSDDIEYKKKLDEFIYSPHKTNEVTIDYIIP